MTVWLPLVKFFVLDSLGPLFWSVLLFALLVALVRCSGWK